MFAFRGVDKIFLTIVIALTVVGFFVFASASLGLLGTERYDLQSVLTKQFLFGIVLGFGALTAMAAINYRVWRKYAYFFFGITVILALLTFTPIGLELQGARRWIEIGQATFQPAEVLKIGYVLCLAAFFSRTRRSVESWKKVMLPFLGVTALVAVIMYLQRDTDGLIVMLSGGGAIFLATGVSWRKVGLLVLIGIIGIGGIIGSRAYLRERVSEYFFGSEATVRTTGWQKEQSLIAIGSGGLYGRGYGQSVQKFGNLPEATSDAIFAVYAEESGFVGATFLIGLLYVFFMLRGYRIASHAKDVFGTLLVVGLITMLMVQATLNIAAITGSLPFTGLTLPFISQGGTSLLVVLATMGLILNVSKRMRKVR